MGSLVSDVFKGVGTAVGDLAGGLSGAAGADINYQASLDPAVLAQQQAFIQALQQQMQGAGPNLAQAQLRQATSEAQQRAAGMAASQKGISPALAQRQALQNQAAMQQAAAGQSGLMQAQQQLATQQVLGQQLAQQQQQRLGLQGIQAGVAEQQAGIRGGVAGGLLGGLSGAGVAFAGRKAEGGMIDNSQYQSPITRQIMGMPMTPPMLAAHGNIVPGHAEVPGDSYANDKVSAILSPGEIVIPRSVALADNAPEKAKQFVKKTLDNHPNMTGHYQMGGQVPATDFVNQIVPQDILQQTQASLAQQMPTAPVAQSALDRVLADVEERNRRALQGEFGPSMMQKAGESVHALGQAFTPKSVSPELAQQLGIQYTPPVQVQPAVSEQAVPVDQLSQLAQQYAIPQAAQAGMPTDIYGYGALAKGIEKGIGEQKAGLMGEAKATGALGAEQAKIMQTANDLLRSRQAMFDTQLATQNDLIKKTNQEIQDAKIDPNKYLGDMSTLGKVSTAIGLVLGGIGGGLQRTGKNVALDVLNAAIDRDINAQKANLDKKSTLLNSYYHQLGDMRQAEQMARATMLDQASNELKAAAAKAQDPIARARALQAVGQLDTQYAQTLSQAAARSTLLKSAGQAQQVPPELVIKAVVPEGEQKDYYKELKDMQNTVKTRDGILSAFDKLNKIATVPSYLASPIQTSRQVKAIMDPLTAELSKETAGRFTEQDSKMLEGIWPKPGDDAQTIRTKKMQLDDMLSKRMNFPMLAPLGITPETAARYGFGMGGQKAIKLGAPVLKGK